MKYLPDLKNLSIALHQPDQYQTWVDELLAGESDYPCIEVGESALFHHPDTFDIELFEMSFGKVETLYGENRDEIEQVVNEFFMNNPYEYCMFRLSQHFTEWIQEVQKHGALFLDATVDLVFDLHKSELGSIESSKNVTSEMKKSYKPQILEIASSFCHGRFFTDPDLKKGFEAYTLWLKNSLTGIAANRVYAFVEDETVHGVMTMKETSLGNLKGWKVPVLGKHGNSNKKNVSTEMLKHLIYEAKQQNVDFILISTQASNIAAQRGYLSAGFEIYSSAVTLGWKKGRS